MGKDFINKINKSLKSKEELEDLEFSIHKFQLLKKENILRILVKSDKGLSKEQEDFVKKYVLEVLNMDINIEILCYIGMASLSFNEIINKHWIDIIEPIIKKHPVLKSFLINSKKIVNENSLEIVSGVEFLCEFVKRKK